MTRVLFMMAAGTVMLLAADKIHHSSTYQQCLDNSGGVTTNMRMCSSQELKYQDNLLKKTIKMR